ncbi:hypothetical protein L7F22_020038 [Adiantum nelumboides]|nr:hypothetical protein [Adiantum nelumboides]
MQGVVLTTDEVCDLKHRLQENFAELWSDVKKTFGKWIQKLASRSFAQSALCSLSSYDYPCFFLAEEVGTALQFCLWDVSRTTRGVMDLQCSLQPANNGDEEHQTSSSTEEDISDQSQNSLSTESMPPPNVPQRSPLDVSSNSPIGDGGLHHAANGILPSQPIQNGTKVENSVALDDDKKREHKRRSKNWTRAETLKLIKMRTELDERFRRSGKKAMLWKK